MEAVGEVSEHVGVERACESLSVCRAGFYRWRARAGVVKENKKRSSPLQLSDEEQRIVLDKLNSERFVDMAPAAVHAILLEEGIYLCSVRTMYRVLAGESQVLERRNQRRLGAYKKPELVATGPNQLWSWDITKLPGPVKGVYFNLYVVLDVFSRYVVGWMVAHRETAQLAKQLLGDTIEKHDVGPGQLTVHSDRGPSMKSKTVALLLSNLSITKTHSRPYVSNDNAYSESQFKTLKYRPSFPARFGSIEDARGYCQELLGWYNTEHRHSGIAMLTPECVHYGQMEEVLAKRATTLREAFKAHAARFKGRMPRVSRLPKTVWINKPVDKSGTNDAGKEVVGETAGPSVVFPSGPTARGNPHRARKASENHIKSGGASVSAAT